MDVRAVTTVEDDDLANLREDVAQTLRSTCEVLTHSYVSDGAGGRKQVSTITATYACKLGNPSQRELELAQRSTQKWIMAVVLPWNAVVNTKQQLRINSTVYEIVEVIQPDNAAATRVLVARFSN
jgi:hypothetical protein